MTNNNTKNTVTQQMIPKHKEAAKGGIIQLPDEPVITRMLQLQDSPLHEPLFNRFMAQHIAQTPNKRPIILTIPISKDYPKSTAPDMPNKPLNQCKKS